MKKPSSNRAGFTLVELLIVVAMFGFLIVALFTSYFQIRDLLLVENEGALVSNRAMLTLKTLSEDLNNLFVEGRWNTRQIFLCKKEVIGGKRVDFINFSSSKLYSNASTMQSSVRMVSYFGEVDEQTGNVNLFRRESAFVDYEKPLTGIGVPIFENVEKLEIQFSRDGVTWQDEWNYTSQKVYPKHIKVTLGWNENSREREFSFEVQPPILWN